MSLNDLYNPGSMPMLDNPANQLLFDLATEHRKVLHGAYLKAIREITGQEPNDEDLRKHGGIESFDHLGFVEYLYKGRELLRVFAPEVIRQNGRTIVHQRIDERYKQKGGGRI